MAHDTELTAGALARRAEGGRLWLFSWPLLAATYAYVFFLSRGQDLLLDGDTYSHIAIGRWILEHGVVPTQDHFSHTKAGTPWIAFEWLSQVVLAIAHQMGGWTGVVALSALSIAVTIALLTRELLRSLEPIYALLFAGAAISMTAGHVLARPHLLAMPLLMLWTIELVHASEEQRTPKLWVLPMMTLWANLHGGFTLGLAIAAAFALEALIEARRNGRLRSALRAWALFMVLAVFCSFLTPHGPRGLWVTWQTLVEDTFVLSRIGEWQSPNFHTFQPLELWLLGGLALALHQGLRLPPVRLLLLLGLMHLALKHARYVELVGQLAPVFLAAPLAQQWRQRRLHGRQLEVADKLFAKLSQPAGQGAVAISAAVVLALPLFMAHARPITPPATIAPVAAIDAARKAGLNGNVLNAYEWGGYLVYLGIPSFIDGRSDLYRDAFIENYVNALEMRSPDGLAKLLERHRVGWTLLSPSTAAVAFLDRQPGWRRVYADGTAVVHMRNTGHAVPGETRP